MSRYMRKSGLLCLLFLLLLVGCDAPDVDLVISPEFQTATIQVDFIRVQRSNLSVWMSKDVDDYFSPGDSFREHALGRGEIYSVYYNVPQREFNGHVDSEDAVWERFQFDSDTIDQKFDVIIMADIPGVSGGSIADIRRQVIPLYRKAWDLSLKDKIFGGGLDQLTITITGNGILLDPAPLAGR